MKNLEIATIFRDIAKILEIKGDNPFRIRAYERAAQNIEGLTEDIEGYIKEDRLTEIPGIGKDISLPSITLFAALTIQQSTSFSFGSTFPFEFISKPAYIFFFKNFRVNFFISGRSFNR